MLVWKQITAEQWVLRIAAQMAGGVLAFPIIQGVASMYDVQIGGPTFALGECEGCLTMLEALVNECVASFILLMGIFIFCTTVTERLPSGSGSPSSGSPRTKI